LVIRIAKRSQTIVGRLRRIGLANLIKNVWSKPHFAWGFDSLQRYETALVRRRKRRRA
jgi:hypothetical protein